MEILFLLLCVTENGNPVSPYFASQKMETLFLLVLRHRKWKLCFSLFCVTEDGKPVSPCFCSQKNGKPCFALPCITENETLFLLVLPLRKQQIPLFLKVSSDFSSST
jgi:hypothetical protein